MECRVRNMVARSQGRSPVGARMHEFPTVSPRSGRVVVNWRWRMAGAGGATLGRDDPARARSESAHRPDACLPVTLSNSRGPSPLGGSGLPAVELAARTVRTTSETEASQG